MLKRKISKMRATGRVLALPMFECWLRHRSEALFSHDRRPRSKTRKQCAAIHQLPRGHFFRSLPLRDRSSCHRLPPKRSRSSQTSEDHYLWIARIEGQNIGYFQRRHCRSSACSASVRQFHWINLTLQRRNNGAKVGQTSQITFEKSYSIPSLFWSETCHAPKSCSLYPLNSRPASVFVSASYLASHIDFISLPFLINSWNARRGEQITGPPLPLPQYYLQHCLLS